MAKKIYYALAEHDWEHGWVLDIHLPSGLYEDGDTVEIIGYLPDGTLLRDYLKQRDEERARFVELLGKVEND